IFRIDFQNLGGDGLALLEDFVRVLDTTGPTDVADVHESVEAVFDFDKGAEFSDVANLAGDHGADRILLGGEQPGIGLRLLNAERHAAVARLDVEHDNVNIFADFGDPRGMLELLGPAQLGDVDEALDALFELDEDSVVDYADDLAL